MTSGTGARRESSRRDLATVLVLGAQALIGILLGGLWLYLMLADAAVQGYTAADYLAPVVVLGLGAAFCGCAFLTTRGASRAVVPIAVTQVIAMGVGAYSLFLGAQVGMVPLVLGFLVLHGLSQRRASE
ncbi:hypothetical protein HUO13_27225 [Saccharopolyspora erythraea]|uniref:hypothetical protein n=1 Tax=Saccharopolyspora erythraea TaxID=1836 RepID=UPI001BA98889|nr:hypothetical protein [Saccharopolyspora erythraea]QUH04019.1 hypothetical protein HUO13_27225 [Saccharopolyspora erythraea]